VIAECKDTVIFIPVNKKNEKFLKYFFGIEIQ
jgi:hypothetical protein